MFEFILGVLMSPWIFTALVLFAVICEAGVARPGDYSGWSIVWSIPLAITGYLIFSGMFPSFQFSLVNIGIALGGYVLLGTLWSLWRYRCFVHDKITYVKERYSEGDPTKYHHYMTEAKDTTTPRNNMGFIVFNIALFPISFVAHMLEDVLRGLHAFVKKYLIGVFNSVHKKLFVGLE